MFVFGGWRMTPLDYFALCFNSLRNFFPAKQATAAGGDYPSLVQSGTKWSDPRESGAQALCRRNTLSYKPDNKPDKGMN